MICRESIWRPVYIIPFLLVCSLHILANPDPQLKFIRNKTQWPRSIDFQARIPGGNMHVSAGQFTYFFLDQKKLQDMHERGHHTTVTSELHQTDDDNSVKGQMIRVTFTGSNPQSTPLPFGKLDEYYNYFLGKDSTHWSSYVPAYEGMVYPSLYKGIDMKIYSISKNLKYDFMVEPGADPSQISFIYAGADRLYLSKGDLKIETSLAQMTEKEPVAFQIINGKKIYIKCGYVLKGNTISFSFKKGYDTCYPLVIDPVLIFSTYSGASADSWGSTATPGEHGNLYSSGVVNQTVYYLDSHNNLAVEEGTFPVTPGAFQTSYAGEYDVGILKYDSTGTKLLYATYLGGSDSESPHSLVMNANQELLVLGTTGSSDFPTSTTAFDKSYNNGKGDENVINYDKGSDIFIARISKDGGQLLASTYLGGSLNDGLNPSGSSLVRNYGDQLRGDIITDAQGNVFVSTVTASPDFPTANSFNTTYKGGISDALLIKMNADLSQIVWSAFMGGSYEDASHTIQLDKDGNIFVGGGTASSDFPSTPGTYQPTFNGGYGDVDGWIAKIKGDGTAIIEATFTGTASFNQVYFLDLDKDENVYAYGQTVGAFPITSGVYQNANSGQFLQKFDNALTTLIFSTVFGSGIGKPNISPTAFIVNECNNIYMTGWGGLINSREGFWQSNTTGMAVTSNAFQKTTSGSDFYFIVLSSDASQLLYATFMGGSDSRTHVDGGTCRFDKNGIVYHAVCSGCSAYNATDHSTSDFPTTANAYSRVNGSKNCNNAAFKFDLSSLKAIIQTNNVSLNQPGYNHICLPDKIVFQNESWGGQYFYWDFGDHTLQTKTDTSYITHQYASTGQYTIKLKAVDVGTCIGKDSTYAVVNVFKPQGYGGPDVVMCDDAGIQISAGGGTTYAWISNDQSFTSSLASPSVNPANTESYYVSITDENNCVKKDTINVRVVPGIDLKFTASRVNYDCYSRPSLKVINLTDASEDVFFDFGDGSTSDLDQTIHQYDKDGVYTIRLVGKKEFCIYDKEVSFPFYELKVPNVFTPEQSLGFNDTFEIHYGGKPISQSSVKVSLVVYNQWGTQVWKDSDYKDDWTGSNVVAGVYYYEATIEGETTCKGWVQVMK